MTDKERMERMTFDVSELLEQKQMLISRVTVLNGAFESSIRAIKELKKEIYVLENKIKRLEESNKNYANTIVAFANHIENNDV